MVSRFVFGITDELVMIMTSGCDGGRYPISAALFGESTVNVDTCLDAYTHDPLACADAHPSAIIYAHISHHYRGASINASLLPAHSPASIVRTIDAAKFACPSAISRL